MQASAPWRRASSVNGISPPWACCAPAIPLTSDGSLKQICSAIATGGCLVVAPADARGDPTELTRLMIDHDVTFAVATPSEWSMWFRFLHPRICVAAPLWLPPGLAVSERHRALLDSFRELSKVLPNLRCFNTYGPARRPSLP